MKARICTPPLMPVPTPCNASWSSTRNVGPMDGTVVVVVVRVVVVPPRTTMMNKQSYFASPLPWPASALLLSLLVPDPTSIPPTCARSRPHPIVLADWQWWLVAMEICQHPPDADSSTVATTVPRPQSQWNCDPTRCCCCRRHYGKPRYPANHHPESSNEWECGAPAVTCRDLPAHERRSLADPTNSTCTIPMCVVVYYCDPW